MDESFAEPPAEPTSETPLDTLTQSAVDTTLLQAGSSVAAQDTRRDQPLDTTGTPTPTEPTREREWWELLLQRQPEDR